MTENDTESHPLIEIIDNAAGTSDRDDHKWVAALCAELDHLTKQREGWRQLALDAENLRIRYQNAYQRQIAARFDEARASDVRNGFVVPCSRF